MLHSGVTDLTMIAESYIEFPDEDNRPMPNVHVKVDPATGKDAEWLIEELRNGDPAIAVVGHAKDPQIVRIDVRLLEDEEIAEISRRLNEILG